MTPGALLALAAATAYGAADFCGGLASRRSSSVAVLLFSQIAGLAVFGAILPFAHVRFHASDLPFAAVGGFAAAVGIGLLYAALAAGRMSVVSPITAVVSAAVPVAASLAAGQRIPPLAAFGCALAVVAIVAISSGGDAEPVAVAGARGARAFLREPGVLLALGSGLAIGVLYVALSRGHDDGRLAIVAEMRVVSIPLFTAFGFATRRRLAPARASWPLVATAGVLDMAANAGFVLATRVAPLSIAAVLTSLYPASTVVLALVVLRERLSYAQMAGVGCAIVAVVCIAHRAS